MHKFIEKLFGLYKENGQLILKIFSIKMKFKWAGINQLEDVCCIQNLKELLDKGTKFPHPIGIVINKNAKIGRNCTIWQNVTIGGNNATDMLSKNDMSKINYEVKTSAYDIINKKGGNHGIKRKQNGKKSA